MSNINVPMESNPVFDTAVDFVNNTACHIFLTGKAGTGKTTFLKYIKEHTAKRSVVVAPTGVAAINAGGVTMHSFFQLPFGPYVPVTRTTHAEGVTDRQELFRNIRFSEEKRELLRDLELLIIDEVSMVRCDTLDAIDAILRHFRKRPNDVFGGVQVLYIGDLFQLPPVIPQSEWAVLKTYYTSEFFFHAKAIGQAQPIYIALKKIYRQNEQHFIDILNRVRNDEATARDLEVLNARYGATPVAGKNYITLTSHNHKADKINQQELAKLPGRLYEFQGTIEGDFPEKALPTDMTLQLKKGAQVMFIRNDTSEDRRYYNGKIVTVKEVNEESITVILNDGEELQLEKETWDNIRYSYNQVDDKIDEEKLGAFSQYPVRLAWAVTIHKSQGLTFEHAIIDAGESFAPGQVYVALSRCTSLDGMVLHSKIERHAISTHKEVLAFSAREHAAEELQETLRRERHIFLNQRLIETFDLQKLIEIADKHVTFTQGKKLSDVAGAIACARKVLDSIREQQAVALKFRSQLGALLEENDHNKLKERVSRAIDYFSKALTDGALQPLEAHIESLKGAAKVKKYLRQVRQVKLAVSRKINRIQSASHGDTIFNTAPRLSVVEAEEALRQKDPKREKGASLRDTLDLFKTGITLPEIAQKRGLALGTIESHIASLVGSGEISIGEVISESKLARIMTVLTEMPGSSLTPVKAKLGDGFSFGEIRAVMNHLELNQK